MIPRLSQALSRASARDSFHNHLGSRWYHPCVPAGEAEAYLGWGRGLGQGLTVEEPGNSEDFCFQGQCSSISPSQHAMFTPQFTLVETENPDRKVSFSQDPMSGKSR